MKKLLVLFLFSVAFFTACDDDEIAGPTTTVNLNFKAVYNGQPLVFIEEDYTYPDGKEVKFQTFNFYISDVVLLESEGGDEAELVEIDFVNFSENTTLGEAETPTIFSTNRVPVGKYRGVRIGIGVPPDLNKASANQFGSGHPLRQTYDTHFWSDWGSFIFMKLEGVYDINGDGFDGDDPGFGHHTGTNEVYRTITLLTPIELKEGQPFNLNLLVDALKIYEANGSALDLADPSKRYTHDPNNLAIANYLMDNFSQALVLE